MKTIHYIFLFVSLSFFAQAQTIRRVNATPGVTGVNIYTTAQAAHDASVAGDIIYLEPVNTDNTDYGSLTINRRITLIGTGYDPTLVTGSSFDKRTVSIQNINMNQGSAGSRITGLNITSTITISDANCIIERCKIHTIYLGKQTIEGVTTVANNTIIRNNFATYISGLGNDSGAGATTNNSIITNNIINNTIGGLVSATITRNTFYANQSTQYIFNDVDGSSITANIFDARDPGSFFATLGTTCQGTTLSNNLCTRHAGLPANNGNVNSVSSSTVFKVTNPWSVNPFLESNLELSPTSPALTVGPSSTPIGAFSGTTPFVPSGLTNIPFITDFSINGIGNVNSPLQINVKARSNN
ncbi:hypothetical protein [Emticicia sp. W12TSBA100-4]|uniref:hypothetical protein n=1 Tax=Emticicia sp. W12TSBA100-4 TaxID=3160965 RepID=UPI003306319C